MVEYDQTNQTTDYSNTGVNSILHDKNIFYIYFRLKHQIADQIFDVMQHSDVVMLFVRHHILPED